MERKVNSFLESPSFLLDILTVFYIYFMDMFINAILVSLSSILLLHNLLPNPACHNHHTFSITIT